MREGNQQRRSIVWFDPYRNFPEETRLPPMGSLMLHLADIFEFMNCSDRPVVQFAHLIADKLGETHTKKVTSEKYFEVDEKSCIFGH